MTAPNQEPEPPEGYRLIPREYLEAGNMLPEDALFTGPGFGGWCKSGWRGHPIGEREDIAYLAYATRTPAPEAVAGELGELGDKTCDGKCCERWASLADGSSCPCPICHPPASPSDKDAEKYPEHGVLIEHRDGRMWVYPIEGGDFIWNGDPTFNAISCAKFTRQVADLRSTNRDLLALVDTLAGAASQAEWILKYSSRSYPARHKDSLDALTAALAAVTEFKAKPAIARAEVKEDGK